MAKIKGWEKIKVNKETKDFIQYDNLNNTIYIKHNDYYAYHKRINNWQVFDFNINMSPKIQKFKTKEAAMGYATSYMRSHPRG